MGIAGHDRAVFCYDKVIKEKFYGTAHTFDIYDFFSDCRNRT